MQMREHALQNTPMHEDEMLIGDKAYQASQNCITGWVKNKHTKPTLTKEEAQFNKMLNGVRQRVSTIYFQVAQTNSCFDRWSM